MLRNTKQEKGMLDREVAIMLSNIYAKNQMKEGARQGKLEVDRSIRTENHRCPSVSLSGKCREGGGRRPGQGRWVWIMRRLEPWPDWISFCLRWTAVGGLGTKEI